MVVGNTKHRKNKKTQPNPTPLIEKLKAGAVTGKSRERKSAPVLCWVSSPSALVPCNPAFPAGSCIDSIGLCQTGHLPFAALPGCSVWCSIEPHSDALNAELPLLIACWLWDFLQNLFRWNSLVLDCPHLLFARYNGKASCNQKGLQYQNFSY